MLPAKSGIVHISSVLPVLLALFGASVLMSGCEQSIELVSVSSEREANRVLVALERAGVTDAAKQRGSGRRDTGWLVTVPKSCAALARETIVRLDLPSDDPPGFDALLKQTGLIPTKTDERARLMHAIAGELTRTLEVVDGVTQARVHVVLPEVDLLPSTQPAAGATAAVLIKHTGDAPPIEEQHVQQLVARALGIPAGASDADALVTVYFTPGAETAAPQQTRSVDTGVELLGAKIPTANLVVFSAGGGVLLLLILFGLFRGRRPAAAPPVASRTT